MRIGTYLEPLGISEYGIRALAACGPGRALSDIVRGEHMSHVVEMDEERSDPAVPAVVLRASQADLVRLQNLLDDGHDVNVADENGSTALIVSALHGLGDTVNLLLKHGADPLIANVAGETALFLAARERHVDVVRALIEAGSDVSNAYIRALATNSSAAVESLIAVHPQALDIRNAQGLNGLAIVAMTTHVEVANLLIAHGIDTSAPDAVGNLPILHAIVSGSLEIARIILDAGAEFDRPSSFGETPLAYALMQGREEIARLLVDAGANIRYAYAHVASVGDENMERLARRHLPDNLRRHADAGTMTVAMADEATLAVLATTREDFLVGLTLAGPTMSAPIAINHLPAAVGRILVEHVPFHMNAILRHISMPGVLKREVVVLDRVEDEQGDLVDLIERPMAFDAPQLVAQQDGYEVRFPLGVEVEPINWCNLRCTYCHVSFMGMPAIKRIEEEDLPRLEALKDCFVQIGAAFEPTLNKKFGKIVDFFNTGNCEISVISNVTLLTDAMIDSLVAANLYSVQISFDAGTKATYEKIRRQSDFESSIGNIAKLHRRLQEAGKKTFILLSVVLMRSNIDELRECIDLAEEVGASLLGFQFMVTRFDDGTDGLVDESLDPILPHAYRRLDEAAEYAITSKKNLLIGGSYYAHTPLKGKFPDHIKNGIVVPDPSRQAQHYLNKYVFLQIGQHPKFSHNCVSPYTFARIHADGDVSVCRDFILGNVKAQKFEDIWFGDSAHFVREFLKENPIVCQHCEHYKFCLQPGTVDIDDPNHLGNNVDRTSDVMQRLRSRRLSNEIAEAGNVSEWLGEVFGALSRNDVDDVAGLLDRMPSPGSVNLATADGTTPLLFATMQSKIEIIELLLKRGALVDLKDSFGNTPLAIAIIQKLPKVVARLVEAGSDPTEALRYAVSHDAIRLAKEALALGADPNTHLTGGPSVIQEALDRNNTNMAIELLNAGADLNCDGRGGATMLVKAAALGNRSLASMLLERGVDPNSNDENETTALMHASLEGHMQILNTLLASGADHTLKNRARQCATYLAIGSQNYEIAVNLSRIGGDAIQGEYLLSEHEKTEWLGRMRSAWLEWVLSQSKDRSEWFAELMGSIVDGDTEAFRSFLQTNDPEADVLGRTADGVDALMIAANFGRKEMVEILLNRGSDVSGQDRYGNSALTLALLRSEADTLENHENVLSLLLAAGADPTEALRYAVSHDAISLAKKALALGADPNTRLQDGSPLTYEALERDNTEMAIVLLNAGSDLNCDGRGGATLLVKAVHNGNHAFASMLLERGVDPNSNDENETTALMHAGLKGHTQLLNTLLASGADHTRKNHARQCATYLASRSGNYEIAVNLSRIGGDAIQGEYLLSEHGKTEWLGRMRSAWLEWVLSQSKVKSEWFAELMGSIVDGDTKAFRSCLEATDPEADVQGRTADGVDALMIAANFGRKEMVETLLNSGADVAAQDRYGNTALTLALLRGHTGIAELIVDKIFDLDQVLIRSLELKGTRMAMDLLKAGANPNAQLVSPSGKTALMLAVLNNMVEVVARLLALGADPELLDERGHSAVAYAKMTQNPDMMRQFDARALELIE
jgi:hypothetical protein